MHDFGTCDDGDESVHASSEISTRSLAPSEMLELIRDTHGGLRTGTSSETSSLLSSRPSALNIGSIMEQPRTPDISSPSTPPFSPSMSGSGFRAQAPVKQAHPQPAVNKVAFERAALYTLGSSDPFAEGRGRRRGELCTSDDAKRPMEQARPRTQAHEPISQAVLYRRKKRVKRRDAAEKYHTEEREKYWHTRNARDGTESRDV